TVGCRGVHSTAPVVTRGRPAFGRSIRDNRGLACAESIPGPGPRIDVTKGREMIAVDGMSVLTFIDLDDAGEHVERFRLRPLEGVAADDRAVGATGVNGPDFVEHAVESLRLTAGEDHDAAAVEGRLHHMLDARRRRRDVDALFFIDGLGCGQLEMR